MCTTIDKIFPEYFERFKLPDGARNESIEVYRACRSGKCDKASFLPSYEESGFVLNPLADPSDPGNYSLSTYEKPTHVKRFADSMSDMKVPYTIAKERKKTKGSHVDWWLYENARPYEEFQIIKDFEKHLKNYIDERDGVK